jgi:hypothetical protein
LVQILPDRSSAFDEQLWRIAIIIIRNIIANNISVLIHTSN